MCGDFKMSAQVNLSVRLNLLLDINSLILGVNFYYTNVQLFLPKCMFAR